MRRSSIKNFIYDPKTCTSDIIKLQLINLFLLKNEKLARQIDLCQVVTITARICKKDESSAIASVYFNIIATMISYE